MTRMPRRESDGKPLPNAFRRDDDGIPVLLPEEEPTVRIEKPGAETLDQELSLHAEYGQGPETGYRRPL